MAFVLEYPTDEQLRQQGFAESAYKLDFRHGMHFVSAWSVDRDKNAYIVITAEHAMECMGELLWRNYTIKISARRTVGTKIPEELRIREEKRTGQHLSVFYEIKELVVPEELKNDLDEIKKIIEEGLNVYGGGTIKFYGTGYTIFSPELIVHYSKLIKSKVKLRDFSTTH